MLEGLPEGVMLISVGGDLLFANRHARNWLSLPRGFGEYAERPARGSGRRDAVRDAFLALGRTGELRAIIQQAIDTGEDRAGELVLSGPQGIRLNVRATFMSHEPAGDLLVVLADITELKRLENARRDLVANVSHDLKTPVGAIRALAESLAYTIEPQQDTITDFTTRIVQETERLRNLIDEMLQLSRLESGSDKMEVRPADVSETAMRAIEAVKPLADARKLSVSLSSSGETEVPHDTVRIQRSIMSILDNAIKFSPSGSHVEVSAHAGPDDVTVEVTDHGEGMTKDVVDRIFERFYRAEGSRHSRGSGLGLSIVKHTVSAHGGTVFASSNPGKGSTIGFTLPRRLRPSQNGPLCSR
jgi:signal transduction histidine kinase